MDMTDILSVAYECESYTAREAFERIVDKLEQLESTNRRLQLENERLQYEQTRGENLRKANKDVLVELCVDKFRPTNQLIEAIKLYRGVTGSSLKEAHTAIREVWRGVGE